MPASAIAGYNTSLELTGTATTLTNEACTEIVTDRWQITDADKRILDPATAVVVEASEDSGSTYNTLGAAEFSLSHLFGHVDLDAYTSGSGVAANVTDVRISGKYLPNFTVAKGRSVNVEVVRTLLDETTFDSGGAVARKAGLLDVSGDFETLDLNETELDDPTGSEATLIELVLASTSVVLTYDASGDGSAPKLRAWIILNVANLASQVDNLGTKNISFQGDLQTATTKSVKVVEYAP